MYPTGPGTSRARAIRAVSARTRESLSPAAVRMILDCAEILHEGDLVRDEGGTHWFGTTFVSLDTEEVAERLEMGKSQAARRRLVAHLRASPEFRVPLMRMARREIMRRLGRLPLVPLRADLEGRLEGSKVLFDMSVEVRGL